MFHSLLVFSLIEFIFSQTAQSQNAAWIYPPIAGSAAQYSSDLVWQVGSTQTLSWQSSYPTAMVLLNQQTFDSNNLVYYDTIVENLQATELVWVVTIGNLNLNTSPIFYLGLNASDSNGDSLYVTAHYVNITTEARATSSTTSLTSSTAMSSATSSKAISSIAQNVAGTSASGSTSSSSTDTTTKGSGGLSTGAAAGIAVICTLVFVCFIAGLSFFFCRNRKRRRQLVQGTASGWRRGPTEWRWKGSELAATQISELDPGHSVGYELDGTHGRY